MEHEEHPESMERHHYLFGTDGFAGVGYRLRQPLTPYITTTHCHVILIGVQGATAHVSIDTVRQ